MNIKRLQLLFSILISTISMLKVKNTEFRFGATDDSCKRVLCCEQLVFPMITKTNQSATVRFFFRSTLKTTVNIHVNYIL